MIQQKLIVFFSIFNLQNRLLVTLQKLDILFDRLFFSKFSILFWLVSIDLYFFGNNFLGLQYTRWDSHDAYFTEFIMFSDAIRDGHLPLINQFIQSGSYIPMFGRTWFYSIFNFPFLILSYLINPLIAFEILLQFYAVAASFGFYLFLNILTKNRAAAIFGSTAYLITLSFDMLGQMGYLLSLSILPWMLYIFHRSLQFKEITSNVVIGILLGIFLTGCDPWHILIAFSILSLYIVIYIKLLSLEIKNIYRSAVFILIASIVYLLLNLDGILHLLNTYNWVNGIYNSPEPRLRSIGIQDPQLLFDNIIHSLLSSIDIGLASLFTDKSNWYRGSGVVVFSVFMYVLYLKNHKHKNLFVFELIFIPVAIFFIFYSAAISTGLYPIILKIPLLNSHRWFSIGLEYTIFTIISIASLRLSQIDLQKFNLNFLFTYSFFLMIFYFAHFIPTHIFYISSNMLYYFFIPIILMIIFSSPFGKFSKKIVIFSLIVINLYAYHHKIYFFEVKNDGLIEKIEERKKDIVITNNEKFQPKSDSYIFYDPEVFTSKRPTTHGYNIIGNPIHWYFRNTPITSTFFTVTRKTRPQNIELNNEYSISSNDYITQFTQDIIKNLPTTTVDKDTYLQLKEDNNFNYVIDNIEVTPSSGRISLNASNDCYILFNTIYYPEWKVFVNNKEAKIIKSNGIFMGVYVNKPGKYTVLFKYDNKLFTYILFFIYFILFISITSLIYQKFYKINIQNH